MKDERYVYSAGCTWHGPIQEVIINKIGLPCCPHCGSVLFEMANKKEWDKVINHFAFKNNLIHYAEFIESLRLKPCKQIQRFNFIEEYNKFIKESFH